MSEEYGKLKSAKEQPQAELHYGKGRDMEKNQIIKIYGTDYKAMTKQLLEMADLAAQIPDAGTRIGIKPNLVSAMPASNGGTTHPEVVAGIIEYLQEHGFRNLLMMEGSWVGDKTADAVSICGYGELSRIYGVEFRDMQKERFHAVDCQGLKLNICDCVDKIDFLINVPVMKGHCQTKITCALKNMKGLIPNQEKRRFHSMGLHRPIAHLSRGIHQDFIVVDHICGDLDFEDGGNPVVCNCVMAALDPVLVDAYVCHLLHYQVDEVPYVRMAEALGSGCADISKAEILRMMPKDTETVDMAEKGYGSQWILAREYASEELPQERKIVELQDAVQEVDSCSACYGYLIPALDRLREEGLLDRLDTRICIGQGYQGQTGKVGIGRCTKAFEYNVAGCPPTETQIYEFLRAYLDR